MTINYATVLAGKLGIAYDFDFQGHHINMTMKDGFIVECSVIGHGTHTQATMGMQADIAQYLIENKAC